MGAVGMGFWNRMARGGLSVLAAVLHGMMAAAHAAEEVRIVRGDGSEIRGTMKSFEDGIYVIATPKGDVSIDVAKIATLEILGGTKAAKTGAAGANGAASAAAGGAQGAVPSLALNSTVAITMADKTQHVGRLISFEDGYYELETAGGRKQLAIANVSKVEQAGAAGGEAQPAVVAVPAVVLSGGSISISGSRAAGETVVRQLVEAYARAGGASNPRWTQRGGANERTFVAQAGGGKAFSADVLFKGTVGAIDDLVTGKAEVVLLERPITADEAQRLAAGGVSEALQAAQQVIVAPSAVILLAHPSNPVKSLTLGQAADIFAGRIRNWSEVGGANRRIQVLAPAEGSGLIDIVKASGSPAFEVMAAARRVASSLETADLVGADPAAIGLADADYRGNATALAIATGCGGAAGPDPFQIASANYPLVSNLVAYRTNKASKQALDFLVFAQSEAAQRLLAERGLVSLTPRLAGKGSIRLDRAAMTKSGASARFSEVAGQFIEGAQRLSLTFRFDVSSNALDARGLADLDRLVSYAKSGAIANRTLSLVGYWENTGDFAGDVAQSKARAVLVSEALKQKGLDVERLFGFGPLMPVSCGSSPDIASRNRRVEVWVE